MRYVIRTLLGMGLFAFCWLAIRYMELVATREGPKRYVQLDINRTGVSPPWTYGAPLDGEPLTVGDAPPKPVTEPEP
jgi:hypothetical protein